MENEKDFKFGNPLTPFVKNPNFDPFNVKSKRFVTVPEAGVEAEKKATENNELLSPLGQFATASTGADFFTPPAPVVTPPVEEKPTVTEKVTEDVSQRVTDQPKPEAEQSITVQQGETLSSIATRLGTDVATLARINNISDPNQIQAGVSLKVAGTPTGVEVTEERAVETPTGAQVEVTKTTEVPQTGDRVTDDALKTLASSAGKAGLGVSAPSAEESTAIRNNLGIPNLIDEAFDAPDKTTTDLYKELYDMTGLNTIKGDIAKLNETINQKRDDLVQATGALNNNPWISQSTRAGRLRNLQELAFADIGNDIAQKDQALDLYDNAIDEIERQIGLVITDREGARGLTVDKLNFLLTEAERDEELVERTTLTRGLRNIPDFLQGVQDRETLEFERDEGVTDGGSVDGALLNLPNGQSLGNAFSRSVLGLSKDARGFAQSHFNDLIQAGNVEEAKEFIIQSAIEGASVDTTKKLIGREEALESVDALRTALNKYTEAGGKTGVLKGGQEKLLQKLGRTSDPVLAEIENEIRLAIQAYRSAISGAAFTESESKEYERIFPNIDRGHELNTAKLDSLETVYNRNQKVFFVQKLGNENYNVLFEQTPQGIGVVAQEENPEVSDYLDTLSALNAPSLNSVGGGL